MALVAPDRRLRRRRRRQHDHAATATATAPAGGGGGSATAGVYVGEVGGTNHLIALVTDGGTRVSGAYLCVPQGTSQWIKPAQFQGGQAALVARNGTVLGSAKFSGNTATGTINSGGQNSFTAKLASGKAGLYRKTSGTSNQPGFSETGWIVLPDGTTCGSTNSITSGGGFQSQPDDLEPRGSDHEFLEPVPVLASRPPAPFPDPPLTEFHAGEQLRLGGEPAFDHRLAGVLEERLPLLRQPLQPRLGERGRRLSGSA